MRGKQQGPESRMKQLDVADTDRSDRIAMIGEIQMKKWVFGSRFRSPLLPVLHRHFERDFNGRRPVVRVKDARKSFRSDGESAPARDELLADSRGRAAWSGRSVCFGLERTVERGVSMAMEIDPNG